MTLTAIEAAFAEAFPSLCIGQVVECVTTEDHWLVIGLELYRTRTGDGVYVTVSRGNETRRCYPFEVRPLAAR